MRGSVWRVTAATSLPDLTNGNKKRQIQSGRVADAALVHGSIRDLDSGMATRDGHATVKVARQSLKTCELQRAPRLRLTNERHRQQHGDLLGRARRAPLLVG